MLETPAVSLTCALLSALTEKKIRVVFCNNRHNPFGELQPYYGSHDCAKKLREQIGWDEDVKRAVWTEIVREKIHNQQMFLQEAGFAEQAGLLAQYVEQLEYGDSTNREGHAAKVYFNAIFITCIFILHLRWFPQAYRMG